MDTQEPLNESCFKPVAGMKLVFDPRCRMRGADKKHPCPDCHFCQFCSDSRCHSCREKEKRSDGAPPRKLSLREQISLYDKINANL